MEIYTQILDYSKNYKSEILYSLFPKILDNDNILDIGGGSGAIAEILYKKINKNINFYILDRSEYMESKIKEKENLLFIKGDIIFTKLSQKYYKVIYFSSILHEIGFYSYERSKKLYQIFCNSYHALQDNGKIIIRDFNKPKSNTITIKFLNEDTIYWIDKFNNEFKSKLNLNLKIENNTIIGREIEIYEFIFHYLYKYNWNNEIKESYAWINSKELIFILKEIGFKNIFLKYERNQYVIDQIKSNFDLMGYDIITHMNVSFDK